MSLQPSPVLPDFVLKLDQLSCQLTDKEKEVSQLTAQNRVLQDCLSDANVNLVQARSDLQNEASRAGVLEQKLAKAATGVDTLKQHLTASAKDKDALDRTLNRVQHQLSSSTEELSEKHREVDELRTYYKSVLDAKESSIQSLQKLLAAQQAQAQKQQELFQEEQHALTAGLQSRLQAASEAANAANASQGLLRDLQQDNTQLQFRLDSATKQIEEQHALCSRLQQQVQQLQDKYHAVRDKAHRTEAKSSRALQEAMDSLQGMSTDRDSLKAQFDVIAEAFQAEQQKRERQRSKFDFKLAEKEKEAALLQAQLSKEKEKSKRLEEDLQENVQDHVLQASQYEVKLKVLQQQLENVQEQHKRAVIEFENKLAQGRISHSQNTQELEHQLAQALTKSRAESKAQVFCEKLRAELEHTREQLSQAQYMHHQARIGWAKLGPLLLQLHALSQQAKIAVLSPAGKRAARLPQYQDPVAVKLLQDMEDPSSPMDTSISAALIMLQEAIEQWQSSTKMAETVQAQLVASGQQQQVLRLTVAKLQEDLDERVQEVSQELLRTQDSMQEAQGEMQQLRQQLQLEQAAVLRLQDALQCSQAHAAALQSSLQKRETERSGLQEAMRQLEMSHGKAENSIVSKDTELRQAKHAEEDLKNTVKLLHDRLEQQGKSERELEALKAQIKEVITSVAVPDMQQLHLLLSTGNAKPHANIHGTQLKAPAAFVSNSDGPRASDLPGAVELHEVDASLSRGLAEAAASLSAVLQHVVLLDISHWEMEQGLKAVHLVQQTLTSLQQEMQAGRFSIGAVLVQELVTLLQPHADHAAQDSSLDMVQLQQSLRASRDLSQHIVRHAKNCEGMMACLQNCLPDFLEMAVGKAQARHQQELSTIKAAARSQMAGIRRDLADLRSSCSKMLAEMQHGTLVQVQGAVEQVQAHAAQLDQQQKDAAMHIRAALAKLPSPQGIAALVNSTGQGGDLRQSVHMLQEFMGALEQHLYDVEQQKSGLQGLCDGLQARVHILVQAIHQSIPLPAELTQGLVASDPSACKLSMLHLQEYLSGTIRQAERTAAAESIRHTRTFEVQPLQGQVQHLQRQLKEYQRSCTSLVGQVTQHQADVATHMKACQQSCMMLAQDALEAVLLGVDVHMQDIQDQLQRLQKHSSMALSGVQGTWASQCNQAQEAGLRYGIMVEKAAENLQQQLEAEATAIDSTSAKLVALQQDSDAHQTSHSSKLSRLQMELSSATTRISDVEQLLEQRERELREVRRTLRQRDAVVASMLDDATAKQGNAATTML